MTIERINRITCCHCGAQIDVPDLTPFLLQVYVKYGWTCYDRSWYCKDCRLEIISVNHSEHPHYSDDYDSWGHRKPEDCKSHYFTDEPYDYYADHLQHNLCKICRYMRCEYEEDGSSWMTCIVDEIGKEYWKYGGPLGHNLYSGHSYGAAIGGRICPYFSTHDNSWIGRDPVEDKKNGTFHVPYNEFYDGD